MTQFTTAVPRVVAALVLLGLVLAISPAGVSQASSAAQAPACSGQYYTVVSGDTWSIISRKVGMTVAELKAANPQAVRASNWVLLGEKLCVPGASPTPTPAPSKGYWYQIKSGDTWNSVSRATGLSVQALQKANSALMNQQGWLYVGQRLWVPAPEAVAATATVTPPPAPASPPAEATATPTPTAAAAAPTAAPTAGATTAPMATAAPTAAATATPVAAPEASATAEAGDLPPVPSDCPEALADYPAAISAMIDAAADPAGDLEEWLSACRVAAAGGGNVLLAPGDEDQPEALIVTLFDAEAGRTNPAGLLLVYHKTTEAYTSTLTVESTSRIELLEASDLNEDGQPDLAFSETACGSHTCFGTLSVLSWDGEGYVAWIDGTPTMAGPAYAFEDVSDEGQGKEITLHGGVIESLSAGPQRPWTETYASVDGAAYKLLSFEYDATACLYHRILDANAAFDTWPEEGFDAAIEAYEAALVDNSAEACGSIEDEVSTLQDFARFRLIVAHVAAGNATESVKLVTQVQHPGLRAAATAFMTSYRTTGSVIQACRDTNRAAEVDTSAWQFLADWGYANPSFTAQELCPVD